MSNKTKGRLFVAVLLIIVGGIIFGGVMSMLNWDFTKLSTVRYETNSYEISEEYRDIQIETKEALIDLVPSDDSKTLVVCEEQQSAKHSVRVENGSLVIEIVNLKKWYEYIGISFKSPKITVYIPKGEYGALSVKSSTGDVKVPGDYFGFESIDVSLSTGDAVCFAPSENVKIKTDTGNIFTKGGLADTVDLTTSTGHIDVSDFECEGDVKIKVSTGRVSVTDVRCGNFVSDGNTGRIEMKNVIVSGKLLIERSTGDVKLDGCDADEIFIKTDTGDVSGTLLSEKVFFAETDTGRVDVPKTVNGGRCEINTDTGNIRIDVVQ